jgi:hypothetical protein
MFKKILVAALVAAMMTLAACGGSDKKKTDKGADATSSNKALSYSDFGKQADAACAAGTAKLKPLGAKLTGQAAADTAALNEILPAFKGIVDNFKTLKPPAELQAPFDEFNSINDQQVQAFVEAQTAAEAQDQAGYEAAMQKVNDLSAQSDAAGSKLGAPSCAKSS